MSLPESKVNRLTDLNSNGRIFQLRGFGSADRLNWPVRCALSLPTQEPHLYTEIKAYFPSMIFLSSLTYKRSAIRHRKWAESFLARNYSTFLRNLPDCSLSETPRPEKLALPE
jgi:hypothetical protein